jgi:hypothetical protein
MDKNEYLSQPIVNGYISFVAMLLEEKTNFSHSYFSYSFKKTYKFTSVFDAFKKYEWKFEYTDLFNNKEYKGVSFQDNKLHLSKFKSGIRSSLINHDYDACINWCLMILDWGKVLNGNKTKLIKLGPSIIEYLTNCKSLFESTTLTMNGKYQVIVKGEKYDVIMNAGFTKIYSLMLEDFIIYDGRVGAALGLIEKYFYNATNTEQSKLLSFHYGNARTSNNKKSKLNRNPSEGTFKVSVVSSGNVHTRDNLKANWILQHIIKNSKSKFSDNAEPLRALECALFMIGYHLPKNDESQREQIKKTNRISPEIKANKQNKINNHDLLLRHIQDSPASLPKEFSYKNLTKLAKSVIPTPETTLSGQYYASLKFIQKYCSIVKGDIHAFNHFKELSDPREFSSKEELKNDWQFKLDKL